MVAFSNVNCSWSISHSVQYCTRQLFICFSCVFSLLFSTMSEYENLTTEVLRLYCQQKQLPIMAERQTLINRLRGTEPTKSTCGKRPAPHTPAQRSKRQKGSARGRSSTSQAKTMATPPSLNVFDKESQPKTPRPI